MKIAILARNFTNIFPQSVSLLQAAGHEVIDHSHEQIHANSSEQTVADLIQDADGVIAGMEPYGETVFSQCPNLKVISRKGIGYDTVDSDACRKHNVALLRAAGAAESAVSEYVLSCILHFARKIDLQSKSMHERQWNRIQMPGAEGRTLGLVGFGGVGQEIAKRAAPFGMHILFYCRHPQAVSNTYGAVYTPLEDLLALSDYVSVNLPLSRNTRGLFDRCLLQKMKPSSIFINISRGPIADAHTLKELLDSGHLGGVCTDVFDHEPCTDSPLVGCENAILTPHTAAYVDNATEKIHQMTVQNLIDFYCGKLSAEKRVI